MSAISAFTYVPGRITVQSANSTGTEYEGVKIPSSGTYLFTLSANRPSDLITLAIISNYRVVGAYYCFTGGTTPITENTRLNGVDGENLMVQKVSYTQYGYWYEIE